MLPSAVCFAPAQCLFLSSRKVLHAAATEHQRLSGILLLRHIAHGNEADPKHSLSKKKVHCTSIFCKTTPKRHSCRQPPPLPPLSTSTHHDNAAAAAFATRALIPSTTADQAYEAQPVRLSIRHKLVPLHAQKCSESYGTTFKPFFVPVDIQYTHHCPCRFSTQ